MTSCFSRGIGHQRWYLSVEKLDPQALTDMRRREFITLLGGVAALGGAAALGSVAAKRLWGARAQQRAVPVIGFVNSSFSPTGGVAQLMASFQEGLRDDGYVEGKNVAIEYRGAGGQYDRLPELLSDLIRRQVTLIVATGGSVSAVYAKAATKTIPILFIAGFDPVKAGLVKSFADPGSNATGVSVYTNELAPKRLELLHKLAPKAATIAVLMNPNSTTPNIEIERLEDATRELGLRLLVLEASRESDFEAAFASAAREQADALLVSGDAFFAPRRAQIVALAARHRLPAVYPWREYVEAGGMMSYGPSITWAYHQLGLYAGRILKGSNPSDLPVQLPTTFDWVINLTTVNALGLKVPHTAEAGAEFVE
jgi:putative tryptophan/tyrosine transport system substrate-binding protein